MTIPTDGADAQKFSNARAMSEAGNFEKAIASFMDLVLLGYDAVWFNVGSARYYEGNLPAAAAAYEAAVAAGVSDACLFLGQTLEEMGDLVGARNAYQLGADCGDERALHCLAFLLREVDSKPEAEAVMRNAALHGDVYADAVLASWQWEREPQDELEPRLVAGAELFASSRAALAQLFIGQRRYDEALNILLEGAAKGQKESMIALGNLYWDVFLDIDAAESAYRQGIELGDAHCSFNLAKLLYEQGRTSEVREFLNHAASHGDEFAREALAEWNL